MVWQIILGQPLNDRYDSRPVRDVKVDAPGAEPVLCSVEITGFAASGALELAAGTGIASCLRSAVNIWQSGIHLKFWKILSGPDSLVTVN